MVCVGFGLSTLLSPQEAAREAAELAIDRLGCGRPDLALVVASAAHGQGLPVVVREAERLLGRGVVVGGSVEGIVSANVEVSSFPAVMVLALSGVEVVPFMVGDAEGEELRVGEDIAARAGSLESSDLVVLLADSLSLDARVLAQGLAEQLHPATVLGTGAGPTPRGRPLLWHDGELAYDAVAGFVLRGTRSRVAIAQAGRAVTPPLTITGARGNWVLGLDGRPALDVYREAANWLGLDPGGESPGQLLAGLAGSDDGTTDLLVRNVVGFDPDRRRFSIPEPVVAGQRLALVVLDAGAARGEFRSQLAELDAGSAAFGLYFNCRARGASLFGEPGVEAESIANAFADLPVAGLVGPYQLAPTPSRREPSVLTYAGALALVGRSE